jgi:hypothetical protein
MSGKPGGPVFLKPVEYVHSKPILDPHYFTLEEQIGCAKHHLIGEQTVEDGELWKQQGVLGWRRGCLLVAIHNPL